MVFYLEEENNLQVLDDEHQRKIFESRMWDKKSSLRC